MSFNNMYQLENLVLGLLEAINDKSSDVQESVSESLASLGVKKTELILKISLQFFNKNVSKLSDSHKTSILGSAEKIVRENIENFDESVASQWIELASNEMILNKSKEPSIALQTAASNLLVAIGKKYVKKVFDELQKNFNPGQLPNIFILNTMANLAEINPYGVVPNLSGILASTLPMLGMAKMDNYKCAFASALCKFAEAILYYCSNMEKAPDKSIEKGYFSTQIFAAYEVFFNVWLKTNEAKLRQIIIESIGHFVNLMSVEKLEVELGKIFTGLLGLFRKHSDHFIIAQSLYFTIQAVILANKQIQSMDTVFEPLFKEMFAQILNGLDQQWTKNVSPSTLSAVNKTQNELLRCFAALATRFSDRMLPLLLQKFEQNNEKNRIGALIILKHLVNSCNEQMLNKKQIVISGLRLLLSETNNKVKKHLIQIIIAMAYHDYLSLEGGHLAIEFILKQCSLSEDEKKSNSNNNASSDEFSNEQLRLASENILTLFSTTIDNMHKLIWPHLFEYLNHVDYLPSASVLCKNLAHIGEIKRCADADDYVINYNEKINLPKPFEIFARLIVLCGTPLENRNRGINVLKLMKHFSPNIDAAIVELWDNATPKLLLNLEDKLNNAKFVQKTWEDLIMKLLANSLDQINEEEKICEIAKSFGKQIETFYTNSSDEKHFAFKCLGIVLKKTASKSTIDRQLDIIFNCVNHNSQHEREGCAISFGYTASSHLDSVLLKLETFAKNEVKKSSGGLFSSILKDNKQGDPEQIKATLSLAYGYVTFYAPKDLIISRLEANILRSVNAYASGMIKELVFKQNLLKSIDLITKCMHPDHLQKDFNFSYKTTIFNQIMTFIANDNSKQLTNETKSMCFKICSNLVKLNPKPTEADFFQLIKTSTDSFYQLAVPNEEKKESNQVSNENELLHGNSLFELTAQCLDELLKTVLNRDLSNQGLNSIYKHLEPWLISVNDHERLRSIRSLSAVLTHFASNFTLNKEQNEHERVFDTFGLILGRIVSRITDPIIQIRSLAMECILSLIKIMHVFKEQHVDEKLVEQFDTIKQKLVKTDSNILLSGVNDLSKLLCKMVPSNEQLLVFLEKLIEGLLDVQSHCSSASCIFLNYSIKLRGHELKAQVENIIKNLYTKLSLIQNPQAKLGTLRSIRILFQQHLIESLNVFLTFPIPCNNEKLYSNQSIRIHEEIVDYKQHVWLEYKFYNTMDMIDICQNLCEESDLISNMLEHLLQIWSRCLPYEEKAGVKYASITPIVGTCILNELFANNTTATTEQVYNKNFEKLFSALLIRTASTLTCAMPYPKSKEETTDVGKKEDPKTAAAKSAVQNEYKKLDPCRISIDCFKSFIKCTQSYELNEFYTKENVWDLLSQEKTCIQGYTVLAKGLCLHGQQYIQNVVGYLSTFLSAPYDCQKICVTAFFAELVNHKCVLSLIETLMNNLLTKLIDQCKMVRTLCIRGLGNVSSLGKEEVQKHSTTILSAMMAGLDDKDDLSDDITLESMNGLTKIISLIDENNVRPILINILLKIRPCFEKEKAEIRASAYVLFGELARFAKGPSREPYLEQIHSNFVSFILHLNEQDGQVKKACKYALRQAGPLIESDSVNDLFQSTLQDEKSLHYGEFINDLAKLLVNEFSDKVSFYIMNSVSNFKSPWNEIRCNAVLFAGYLLGHLDKEKQSVLSKEHISNALVKLVKEDPSAQVRKKAAEAISLLAEF